MKLLRYRVTNFRPVTESGRIDTSDVTALIGENEAGKTNLLLPLWKLKPSSGGAISLLDDMPRSRYAEMRSKPENYNFVYAIFTLSEREQAVAVEYGADADKVSTVQIFRDYAGRYGISFPDQPEFNTYKAYKPRQNDGEEEGEADKGPNLWTYLKNRMPSFVYYSNYGNLDDQIYLPHVIENLERKEELSAKERAKARTIKVLFDLVNLSPQEVLELARATAVRDRVDHRGVQVSIDQKSDDDIEADDKKLRERAALLQSASSKLTRTFEDWWKQGDYTFRLHADGFYFRILVADAIRKDEIELENRSTGLQWFLSFFLVFTYESEDAHHNSIVLLDEPGLSLHPLAQRDLSRFFDNLSESHQIIFTTHSPFVIDADRLDRVRKVFIDDDGGTISSANLGATKGKGAKGSGATYTVHSALNLTVAESLLIGCQPVIVEGASDQHYLSAIKTVLLKKGKIKPSAELVFPPAGGAKNARTIATILGGRDEVLPFVLLDSDTAGLQAKKSLEDGLYQASKARLLVTDMFLEGFEGSEVEDLIPSELIVAAIDRMERNADTPFEDVHEAGKPIVPQIKAWAEREEVELVQGWKVELSLQVKGRLLASADRYVTDDYLKAWATLFRKFC